MSPFVSREQEKWAFATHQPWAKEWAAHTPNIKKLPERKKKKSKIKLIIKKP